MHCPTCNGKSVIRYGNQCSKQMYYCKDCKKKFARKGLKNKSYSSSLITNAIMHYNLGNTLEESVKLVNRQFKVKVSKSALHYWLKESSDNTFALFVINQAYVRRDSNIYSTDIFSLFFKKVQKLCLMLPTITFQKLFWTAADYF